MYTRIQLRWDIWTHLLSRRRKKRRKHWRGAVVPCSILVLFRWEVWFRHLLFSPFLSLFLVWCLLCALRCSDSKRAKVSSPVTRVVASYSIHPSIHPSMLIMYLYVYEMPTCWNEIFHWWIYYTVVSTQKDVVVHSTSGSSFFGVFSWIKFHFHFYVSTACVYCHWTLLCIFSAFSLLPAHWK